MKLYLFSFWRALLVACIFRSALSTTGQPLPILRPLPDHTTLEVVEEGLQFLRDIKGPIAPVVVIGPYRSGKSFTLNQLINSSCSEGFGVGHTRETQTKGVWLWGQAIKLERKGLRSDGVDQSIQREQEVNVLFFDTEGFESTGKADSYDDRIFAFSTLISSVLIYNLPEAIRESDLEKLNFATELAKAFFSQKGKNLIGDVDSFAGNDRDLQPLDNDAVYPVSDSLSRAMMIWLIQRDFLRGESLQATLSSALRRVPNPINDPSIAQLNRIREGLEHIASNSTAIGLPQPHLDRTRLCEIPDADLDPAYLKARNALRQAVYEAAKKIPKAVRGRPIDGAELADLITRIIEALNQRDIPTAGSLVEYFNRDLVVECTKVFRDQLEQQSLPVDSAALSSAADAARAIAFDKFETERFGSLASGLRETLGTSIEREYENRVTANTYQSSKVCEAAELDCERRLEREADQRLPSLGRFENVYQKCTVDFKKTCVGPALEHHSARLARSWERESSRFSKEYNEKLLNGMIIASLVLICLFRFFVKWPLGETLGWVAFIFLQVWPRTFVGSGSSFFETDGWQSAVKLWEAAINNPILNVEAYGMPFGIFIVLLFLTRKKWWPKLAGHLCSHRRRKRTADRDLDV